MTIMAFIMIKVEGATNKSVLEEVKAMDETLEAFIIFGAWDIIVQAHFESNEALSDFVVDRINKIPGVFDSQTNVCAATK